MPFEKRPVGDDNPVWRYSANPIIPVNPQPDISRVYNSAVVAFGGAFIGVFRVEKRDMTPRLYLGRSPDGIAWKIEDRPILFTDENGKPRTSNCAYDYDPRVTRIEGVYYITWCTDAFGPVIALARTEDFKTFVKLENATLPCNR
ncbi:MAG: glycosylase, partial [Clostridiales bacterium]|nr:glycosylase [Clostridiales bacterium]